MNNTMDPAERRRLKFEEMVNRHAAETRSFNEEEESSYDDNRFQRYTTFYININGVACKIVVPERAAKKVNVVSCQYASPFSYHVERVLEEMMKEQVVYRMVHDTIHDEIELHASLIAHDNFPALEEQEDGGGIVENEGGILDDEVDDRLHYFCGRVARFAESNFGQTAEFVDNAITNYYDPISIDVIGVLDLITEAVLNIVTEKMIDLIQNALEETVYRYYSKNFNFGAVDQDSIMIGVQSESRLVASRIVDTVCLVVDDALTCLIVRAFRSMCDLPGVAKSNANDALMENVARKVFEMQI